MRLSSFLAVFRPALPLILGLSLGCSLSLLMVSWTQGDTDETCRDEMGNGRLFLGRGDDQGDSRDGAGDEDFQPRIVPYHKDPNKPHKKVLRTRYIHTELGIRERLLVGVLTSRATLNTLAVAVNRTVAHHFHRTFFFTGLRSPKVPHGMTVVAHGDDRPVWLMYETVRHLHQHYGSDYDWFLLAQDDTYMQADRLTELVGHLSAGQDLYMGRAEEFIGGEEKARYCHGGYGYLLSRSLLARLQPHLDTCRNDILSVRPDEWLGRCIIDYLGLSCVEVHQVNMWRCWMPFILAWVSMATPALCQSGDWGSGFDIYSAIMATNDTLQAVGDEPAKMRNNQDWITPGASSLSPSPTPHHEPRPDRCSVHYSTSAAWARRLKAQKEELIYLQAIQHGNEAVVENLVQFVGAELGDQSYEDVIKENIIGIKEDQKSCHEVTEKAEEDLEKQLEGEASDAPARMQTIREESLAFEDMLRAAVDIANRLEVSSQVLHASFTKQLKDIGKIHR